MCGSRMGERAGEIGGFWSSKGSDCQNGEGGTPAKWFMVIECHLGVNEVQRF